MNGQSIIRRQAVEFIFNTVLVSPLSVQQEASQWCTEQLLPALEEALKVYEETEDIIRLDTIEIELLTTEEPFTTKFARQIVFNLIAAIEKQRSSAIKEVNIVNKHQTKFDAFIFFLQHGYLPWWINKKTLNFQQDIAAIADSFTNESRNRLRQVLSERGSVKRLVLALPLPELSKLVSSALGIEAKHITAFFAEIEGFSQLIKMVGLQQQFVQNAVEESLVKLFVNGSEHNFLSLQDHMKEKIFMEVANNSFGLWLLKGLVETYAVSTGDVTRYLQSNFVLSATSLDTLLAHLTRGKKTSSFAEDKSGEGKSHFTDANTPAQKTTDPVRQQLQKQQTKEKEEGIYIGNSGLVLLAPFLPRFFENLGIVLEGVFNSRDLAIAMLLWLVAGDHGYAEFDTVLAKVLCGVEPEHPITIIRHLPEGFKREGDSLLQAVIAHWQIIKNTSVDGLRQSFLQREGKLSFNNREWLLQVEQKAYDMLLQELPWSVHLIKLPWMKHLLRTEWI